VAQDRSAEQPVAAVDAPPFQALYHGELLRLVNPAGDVGVVTLWSPLRSAERRLEAISPEILDETRSRVAVISNLYGDGMYAMFCNLLYNPQVRHVIAIGEDLGLRSCQEIEAFLALGTEDTVMLGLPMRRIVGTDRVFPSIREFDERRLRERLSFRYLGKLSSARLAEDLSDCLRELPRDASPPPERVRVDMSIQPAGERSRRPSALAAHHVQRRTPLGCWEELVVRAVRFGRPTRLRSGPRLELLNARAVISEPAPDSESALSSYGFRLLELLEYGSGMLDPELPQGIPYTYGNRLRAHFRREGAALDSLAAAIETLRADPESRHAFIAVWDTSLDLPDGPGEGGHSTPCLVTLFFRRLGGALCLTATFRSHNLLSAWLRNVYGLMAVQRHVAEASEMGVGAITVISHSLSLDPRSPRYDLALAIEERWKRDDDHDYDSGKYSLRQDPNGYFLVTVDRQRGCIVAEHRFEGVLVRRYEGDSAARLASEIGAEMAVSLLAHALWLGQELARAEARLRGEPPLRRAEQARAAPPQVRA